MRNATVQQYTYQGLEVKDITSAAGQERKLLNQGTLYLNDQEVGRVSEDSNGGELNWYYLFPLNEEQSAVRAAAITHLHTCKSYTNPYVVLLEKGIAREKLIAARKQGQKEPVFILFNTTNYQVYQSQVDVNITFDNAQSIFANLSGEVYETCESIEVYELDNKNHVVLTVFTYKD